VAAPVIRSREAPKLLSKVASQGPFDVAAANSLLDQGGSSPRSGGVKCVNDQPFQGGEKSDYLFAAEVFARSSSTRFRKAASVSAINFA